MKELIIIDNYNVWSIPVRREDDLTIAVLLIDNIDPSGLIMERPGFYYMYAKLQ